MLSGISPRRSAIIAAAALAAVCVLSRPAHAQLAAFAGAQGFGADTTGGRNGSIYVVTNLNDSGAGSFRDAVSEPNRIIVFAVGGYIDLQSAVSCASNLTILGQTAPGQGIGFEGHEISFSDESNEIIQYIRARESNTDTSAKASINMGDVNGAILDHVSAEFSQYDNIDAVGANSAANNITYQNSLIADPIKAQQFNLHEEGNQTTYLNNVFANSEGRSVLAKSNTQFVNNAIYDYGYAYTTGNSGGTFKYDILNNYFVAGPSTNSAGDAFYQLDSNQSAYSSGNLLDSNKNGVLDGSTVTPGGVVTLTSEYSPETQFLPTQSATAAYAFDAAHAGDMYNTGNGTFGRDDVDSQIISQVLSYGTAGEVYNEPDDDGLENGGLGTIATTGAVANTLDTVPFAWLTTHGLSTTNAAGLLLHNALGYDMIEEYAQQIQDQYSNQIATSGEWNTTTWTSQNTTLWASETPGLYDHALIRGNGTTNGNVTISGSDAATAFSLSIGGNGPAAGETLSMSGGTLTLQDTIYLGDQNNATFNLSGGTVRADNLQLGNTVYDSNGNPTNYTGTFNFTGGTLQTGQVVLGAGTPGSFTTGGVWNWNGGTLQPFGGNLTVNAPATLSGTGAIVNTVGPDGVTYSATMSGVLSGTGGFTKQGAGTLTFAVANTYSGTTTISAGAILANVTNAIAPSSTIDINIAAGLQLANGVTISSPIVVGGSIASQFADAPGTANATLAGPISISNGTQYRLGDSGTGTLTYTGTTTDTTSYSFVTGGNIAFGAGGILNDTATGGLTIGRSGTQAVALTVTGTNSAVNIPNVPVGSTALYIGSGSTSYENPSNTLTIQSGGAVYLAAGNLNLDNDPTTATGTIATLNLSTGGTLTTGGFIDTEATVNAAKFSWNGGTVVAGANDPSGGQFFPAFTDLTVAIGSSGAILNDAGHTITLAQPLLTGVTTGTDGGFTKQGGGTTILSGSNTYTGLTTVQLGTLQLDKNAQSPVLTAGGANIQAGSLVFDYNNGGSDPIATIQTDLTFAYHAAGGPFTSGQLFSSTAVTGKTGLGYADNTATGQVTVMYTLYGDANLDGKVDAADFVLLSNNFGKTGTTWSQGNFNYDNTTDAADFVLLSNNFGQNVTNSAIEYLDASQLASYNQMAIDLGFSTAQIDAWDVKLSGVPEPTSLALLAIIGPSMLRRRVRREWKPLPIR